MDPADADGRRRTQAWMGSALGPEPEQAAPPAPHKALRWMPNPGELPSYPDPGPDPDPDPDPAASAAPAPQMAPAGGSAHQVGERIGGRYQLSRFLGHGDLTETWEAVHVELERAVAIKFLRQQITGQASAGIGEKMLEEARAVARIHHPHVVEFSDFGRLESGEPYFVMELLSGQTLEKLLSRRGTMAWARAVSITQQVGSALAAAHQQGIVHRDLRPGNVFLVETGEGGDFVKVVDFGLARGSRAGGTPAYMSPEQCRNEQLDPRSDVYSIGCLIYAMVTGEPPFLGDPEHLRGRQISEVPKGMRERAPRQFIPDELEAIVARCLEKSPARRFADTRELGAELSALADFAAAATMASGAVQDPSASASRPMGYAGRPPPKSPRELTNSYRPVNQPIVEHGEDESPPKAKAKDRSEAGLSTGTIIGVILLSLLVVGGVGVGVWWLVTSLIADDASGAVEDESRGEPAGAAQTPEPSTPQVPAPVEPAPEQGESAAVVDADDHEEAAVEAPPKPAADTGDVSKRKAAKRPEPKAEPEPEPEPAPEPEKPSEKPESKANEDIGHEELLDPWD